MNLRERIKAVPYWYHRIQLPGNIETPGWAPINADKYRLPDDMTGLRVLDVGAWDGFWTFECLKRGASEVVAIDDFSDRLGVLPKHPGWAGFDLCREVLGYTDDECKRIEMSVYDVDEKTLGRFDIVLCFGVIYHLQHPLLGLQKLAAVCDADMYVESAIVDDVVENHNKAFGGEPVAQFCPGNEYAGNHSNWWVPTLETLKNLMGSVGFREVEQWKLTNAPQNVAECRGFVRASRERRSPKIKAVMSVPRLGFLANLWCGIEGFAARGMPMDKYSGAFWEQHITNALEGALNEDCDIVFTIDYDTIFPKEYVDTMIRIMMEHPEIDALAGAQCKREGGEVLMGVVGEDGKTMNQADPADFACPITQVSTAHFGLTGLRATALRKTGLPWFHAQPGPDGRWGEGRVDADMWFWRQWAAAGNTLYQANFQRLGHLELMVTWPAGPTFRPVSQHINSYTANGVPKEVLG